MYRLQTQAVDITIYQILPEFKLYICYVGKVTILTHNILTDLKIISF